MAERKTRDDHRVNIARYQTDKLAREIAERSGDPLPVEHSEADAAGQITMDQRVQFVELQVQQAIRRAISTICPAPASRSRGCTMCTTRTGGSAARSNANSSPDSAPRH